jgi:hypothetical protein
MPDKRYPMPVKPFQEIVERALLDLSVEGLPDDDSNAYTQLGMMTPLDRVTERVARAARRSFESTSHHLRQLRYGRVKFIDFNNADAIVCALSTPSFWYTDERVKDLYLEIRE